MHPSSLLVRPLLLLALVAPLAARGGGAPLEAKEVAAPPADIVAGRVRLPDPAALVESSDVALLPVEVRARAGAAPAFETLVPVESAGPLELLLLAPDVERWRVLVGREGSALQDLAALQRAGAARRDAGWIDERSPWRYDGVELFASEAGAWRVRVEPPADLAPPTSTPPAWLLVHTAGPYRLEAHLATLALFSDRSIGLSVRVREVGPDGASLAFGGTVDSAEARVRTALGAATLVLVDDGRHADGAAGDGELGALLPAGLSGEVTVDLVVRGHGADGVPFLRTVREAFPVLERSALLTGETRVTDAGDALAIDLGAWVLDGARKLHVSAEVWAERPGAGFVPVAWLSRMLVPDADREGHALLPLRLDGRWLDLAGATGRIELRQVRLQDPDTHLPFDVRERLALDAPPAAGFAGTLHLAPGEAPPREMLMGPAPSAGGGSFARRPAQVALRALMLVHGWCSGGSVWPPANFTPPKVVFLDPNANRTQDEFAQLLRAFGIANGLASYGIVAHSQGGLAALHLYTYYWSGLDRARGPRRIQSVGSPYQGTPLASFGFFACGNNSDLTPSGAALWLAGIPTWARHEVSYWTTSNSGSACNGFTNLVLGGVNDGVTRQDLDQLPGGNSMGHKLGWCHTTGMTEPAQYLDATRNLEMDAQAAR